MKVSIIMPAYNSAGTITESIDSVLQQSYRDWELIVVNDCSSDTTVSLVKNYISRYDSIKLITLKTNSGPCIARNEGIRASVGEYICFLDSDDLWHPLKLELQVALHEYSSFKISHTNFETFSTSGSVKRPWKNIIEFGQSKSGNLLPQLYHKNVVGILTVMVQKEVLLKLGGFDPLVPSLEDYDLWIRVAEDGHEFGYINKKLACYRVVSGSLSNSTNKYKRIFKKFINKHISKHKSNPRLIDKIWGNYYRHFAAMHFKNKNYRLSTLYFSKAISHHKASFISITTVVYMILAFIKLSLNKLRG